MKLELYAKGPITVKFRDHFWFFAWNFTKKENIDKKYTIDLGVSMSWGRAVGIPGPFDLYLKVDSGTVTARVVRDGTTSALWEETFLIEDVINPNVQTRIVLNNVRGVTCDIVLGAREVI